MGRRELAPTLCFQKVGRFGCVVLSFGVEGSQVEVEFRVRKDRETTPPHDIEKQLVVTFELLNITARVSISSFKICRVCFLEATHSLSKVG